MNEPNNFPMPTTEEVVREALQVYKCRLQGHAGRLKQKATIAQAAGAGSANDHVAISCKQLAEDLFGEADRYTARAANLPIPVAE